MKREAVRVEWVRHLCGTCCLAALLASSSALAADKIEGHLFVKDALVLPGQSARIEAVLTTSGVLGAQRGLGGEQLDLVVEGKAVARAMTGGDGRAFLEYTPKVRGNHEVTVRLVPNPRVTSPAAKAVLGAWERRRPILLVEMAALVPPAKPFPLPVPSIPVPVAEEEELRPVSDAAEELNRLAQFFYNVIYVSWSPKATGGLLGGGKDMREWLARHKFPRGLWVTVDPGERALGEKIEQLRADGWTNVKAGIGRTLAFAEVLAGRRMEVVIVPEPETGDLPKKAKTVKEWKEIRKKL